MIGIFFDARRHGPVAGAWAGTVRGMKHGVVDAMLP